jgi:hypothetical protein
MPLTTGKGRPQGGSYGPGVTTVSRPFLVAPEPLAMGGVVPLPRPMAEGWPRGSDCEVVDGSGLSLIREYTVNLPPTLFLRYYILYVSDRKPNADSKRTVSPKV